MSKNVLVLSGSPRKGGNSDILCDEFVRGAKESGNDVEKIFISNKEINYCEGCYACSNGICKHDDDMAEILEKMIAADIIVLASPVYFYTLDAQIKTLIDRTVPKYMEIANKEFYFIATAAVPDNSMLDRTFDCFRGFTDCLPGAEEKTCIYGSGVYEPGAVKETHVFDEAYEIGKNV